VNSLKAIHRAVFPAMELVLGMGIAQIIATAQVHVSNGRLFAQMTAVAEAGFLPVPNPHVLPRLLELETAFWGGLFFTLSVGSGLSLLGVAAAMLWRRFTSIRGVTTAALAIVLAGAAVTLNLRGFEPWATLYFVAVPLPVFWMAARWRLPRETPADRSRLGLRFLPLALLALGWSTQYDPGLFIDLRDHLLMSNAAGEAVRSFYYRYTLYPAEVFKTLDQRMIKTIAIPPATPGGCRGDWARELIRLDYLPVGAVTEADLRLGLEGDQGDRLAFFHRGKAVWESACDRFLADPRRALSDISARTDRFAFFRAVAFYGVLLAFPCALYVLLFALLRLLCGIAAAERRADAATAAACLLAGFAILIGFHLSRDAPPPPEAIGAGLASDRWQTRVAALKGLREGGFDIRAFPGYAAMLASPYPQERYWLAQALAASPQPEASADLIRLLDDPQINVRTMALEALARRRDSRAVQPILRFLKGADEWYDQLYAYQALKALRWDQTRLH
jgi:hypothetical protein